MGARKIVMNDQGIPNRIATGVGAQTVRFPQEWVGHPDDFPFNKLMMRHYTVIKKAIERNGLKIQLFGASKVKAYKPGSVEKVESNRVEFVMVAGDKTGAKFVWQKYESAAVGSGQNNVFINGQKMHCTSFAMMMEEEQDTLIEPVEMRRIFRLQGLD